MNYWQRKATENLLKNSNEQKDFLQEKKEWVVTKNVIDHGEIGEDDFSDRPSCDLCEHEDLRWQFEIKNFKNQTHLYVGSTCIKQFDISLFKENMELLGEERDNALNSLKREIILDNEYKEVLQNLRDLWVKDTGNRVEIAYIAKEWKIEKKFFPDDANFIASRLNKSGIRHNPKIYKIYLRSIEAKEEIMHMDERKLKELIPYLTKQQLKNISKYKSF